MASMGQIKRIEKVEAELEVAIAHSRAEHIMQLSIAVAMLTQAYQSPYRR